MRLHRLVPALLAAVCWGADPAPQPVADAALADGTVLIEHWKAGPIHRAWMDPAVQRLHPHLDKALDNIRQKLGFDPLEVLAALKDARFAVTAPGADGKLPGVRAQVVLGRFAALVMQAAAKHDAKPATVAGADEAVGDQGVVLARFAEALVAGFNQPMAAPGTVAPAGADVSASLQIKGVIAALSAVAGEKLGEIGGTKPDLKPVIDGLEQAAARGGCSSCGYELTLVPEGILERITVDSTWNPAGLPVDRAVLDLLPATTLMAAGCGIDGSGYWEMNRAQFTASNGEALKTIDAALAGAGVTNGTEALVRSIKGTVVVALTPGMPAPFLTIALPRSAAVDQAVEAGMLKLEVQAPAEGDSAFIPTPGLPIAIALGRAKTHWVVTTDQGLLMNWLAGTPGGWKDSAAAKLALAKAPAEATVIGASDTPAVLRTISGLLGMAMGMAKDLPPADKQAILAMVQKLAANASTGYVFSAPVGKQTVMEGRGVLGVAVGPVMTIGGIAGLVINTKANASVKVKVGTADGALEDEVAVSTLTSIHRAEQRFRDARHIDQDGDGKGEFALLGELAGTIPVGKGQKLNLVPKEVVEGDRGWSFAVYLPDGDEDVLDEPAEEGQARQPDVAAADQQERRFVAYAWPTEGDKGRMFALIQDGTIFAAPFTGEPPSALTLYGEGGWDAVPAWEKHVPSPKPPAAGKPVKPLAPSPAGDKSEPLM